LDSKEFQIKKIGTVNGLTVELKAGSLEEPVI
jgi:hypothetical protein